MNESKSLKKTKVLVGMAIFTALVVVLQEMAGMIKIGPFSPSLVLIPMVIGPSLASSIINRGGVPVVIDGAAGLAPSAALFPAAAVLMLLTLIPTVLAAKAKNKA